MNLADADVTTPVEAEGVRHVYHLMFSACATRTASWPTSRAMASRRAFTTPSPCIANRPISIAATGASPAHTEQAAAEVISLPLYPELSDADQQVVVDAVGRARG